MHDVELWKHISAPFRLPSDIHRCALKDWQLIDCDIAGCMLCGKIHHCQDNHQCPTVTYEGRHVCEITGFYTRRNVFVDDEFVDTVASVSMPYTPPLNSITREQIEGWVHLVLCSEKAKDMLKLEIERKKHKCKAAFIKFAKNIKIKKLPLNIVNIYTLTAHSVAHVRLPTILSQEELELLLEQCTQYVDSFCRRFLDNLKITPPVSKMHGFVIGLLYLMRVGVIAYGDVEIVPKIPALTLVLPSENHIKTLCKLPTKILTEVENTIKITLRKFTRDRLLTLGFKIV
jgi:hypothetical protein